MSNWNGGQPNPNGYGMYNQGGYSPMATTAPQPAQIAPPPRMQIQQPVQPMPQQAPIGVPGRWVNDFNEITPGEIPMNGTICFFPKTDYTCIYAKVWDKNGKLQDFTFVPETPAQAEPAVIQNNEQMDKVMAKLEDIQSQLSRMNKPYKPNKKPYHPRSDKNKEENA